MQDGLAYVVTEARTTSAGTFQVVDVSTPTHPEVLSSVVLRSRPNDVAVSGRMAYIPAGVNLLIFDVSDPRQPVQAGVVGDLDPNDGAQSAFFSGLVVEGNAAYLLETRCELNCGNHRKNFLPCWTSVSQPCHNALGRWRRG